MFDLVSKSGCAGIFVGFGYISNGSLRAINKHQNVERNYSDVVERAHDFRIDVEGSFVLGFDNDTDESTLKAPVSLLKIGRDITIA